MRPSISGFLRLLSHHVVLGDAGGQRRHRLGVRQLLVRVHEAYGGLGAEHSAEVKPKKCETSVCVCRSTGTGAYVAAGKSCTFSVVKGGGWHFWIRRRVALLDKEVGGTFG